MSGSFTTTLQVTTTGGPPANYVKNADPTDAVVRWDSRAFDSNNGVHVFNPAKFAALLEAGTLTECPFTPRPMNARDTRRNGVYPVTSVLVGANTSLLTIVDGSEQRTITVDHVDGHRDACWMLATLMAACPQMHASSVLRVMVNVGVSFTDITMDVTVTDWSLVAGKTCLAAYLRPVDSRHHGHVGPAAEPVTAALMLLARLGHVSGEAPLDEGVRGLQSIYSAMTAPTVPEPEPASHLEQYVK